MNPMSFNPMPGPSTPSAATMPQQPPATLPMFGDAEQPKKPAPLKDQAKALLPVSVQDFKTRVKVQLVRLGDFVSKYVPFGK